MTAAVVLLAIHLVTGAFGGLAPCTLRLRVRVEPKAENRSIEVTLDSPGFSSASLQSLDGLHAVATQREQTYPDLPRGQYDIRAVVHRPPQRDVTTQTQFTCG